MPGRPAPLLHLCRPGQAAIAVANELVIGRDPSSAIPLDDARVSRRHARVFRSGSGFVLEDLGSANGTLLNGAKVEAPTAIQHGDRLTVGSQEFSFELHEPAAARPRRSPALVIAGLVVAVGGALAAFALQGGHDAGGTPPAPTTTAEAQLDPAPPGDAATTTSEADESRTPDAAPPSASPGSSSAEPSEADAQLASFAEALERREFSRAERLLGRLPAGDDHAAKLQAAIDRAADELIAGFDAKLAADGAAPAARWLRDQSRVIPERSSARRRINEHLLGARTAPPAVAGAGPSPVEPSPSGPSGSTATGASAGASAGAVAGAGTPRPREATATAPERAPERAQSSASADLAEAKDALARGELALRERRFDPARHEFTRVRELIKDPVVHPLRRAALAGLKEIDAAEAMLAAIGATARQNPERLASIPWPADRGLKITAILDDGLELTDRAGAKQNAPWSAVPTKVLDGLATKLSILPEHMLAIAVALRHDGEDRAADEALARLWRRAPVLEENIFDHLARVRGHESIPKGGYQWFEGQWFAPSEIDRAKVDARIDAELARLSDPEPTVRAAAFESLVGLGDFAGGRLRREIDALQSRLEEGAVSKPLAERIQKIEGLRAEVDRLRQEALTLIFDEKRYPYPYRPPAPPEALAAYQETQPKIDELVVQLRKAYEVALEVPLPAELGPKIAQLREIAAWRSELGLEDRPVQPTYLLLLPTSGSLNVRNFARDPNERDRIDRSAVVMLENERVSGVSLGERDQAKITNEYRMLFGRWALKLQPELVVAAHDHCADMERLGFFAHDSPVPGKESPSKRVQKAGFPSGAVGENLAIASGPLGAHQGWTHSPGHHRNILMPRYRMIGTGNVARYWCQVFH